MRKKAKPAGCGVVSYFQVSVYISFLFCDFFSQPKVNDPQPENGPVANGITEGTMVSSSGKSAV